MATASNRQRHERESLLEYISSRGSRYGSTWAERMSAAGLSGAGSSGAGGSANQSATSKESQKDQSELKEQETKKKAEIDELNLSLEQLLSPCADLWEALSNSLRKFFFKRILKIQKNNISVELDLTRDNHAFLVLQPAVEAFFIVHASHLEKEKKEDVKENQDPFRYNHFLYSFRTDWFFALKFSVSVKNRSPKSLVKF